MAEISVDTCKTDDEDNVTDFIEVIVLSSDSMDINYCLGAKVPFSVPLVEISLKGILLWHQCGVNNVGEPLGHFRDSFSAIFSLPDRSDIAALKHLR